MHLSAILDGKVDIGMVSDAFEHILLNFESMDISKSDIVIC